MLRVRCLRGGSRGAEAVHYIGSRVRAPPLRPLAESTMKTPCTPGKAPLQQPFARSTELGGVLGKGCIQELGPEPAATELFLLLGRGSSALGRTRLPS